MSSLPVHRAVYVLGDFGRIISILSLCVYKCSQCYRLLSFRKIRLKLAKIGGVLDMMLCDQCVKAYNQYEIEWTQSRMRNDCKGHP